jgi:hypothetical protein
MAEAMACGHIEAVKPAGLDEGDVEHEQRHPGSQSLLVHEVSQHDLPGRRAS